VGQGIAFLDMAHGAVHVGLGCMGTGAAPVIGVYGEYWLGMAALALGLRAVVQVQACVVSVPCMACGAGFIARDMVCLGIRMAQPACRPTERHVGHVGQGIHMVYRVALPDMAHGAVHVGGGRMNAGAAAIVRIDGEGVQYVAAFALRLGAVVKVQACVVARACMAEGTGLRAIGVQGLGTRMAQPACRPVERHVGHIGQGVQVAQRIALPDMAHGAVHVGGGRMNADAATVV